MMRTQLAQDNPLECLYCSVVEARRILKLSVVVTDVGNSYSYLKHMYWRTVEGFSICPSPAKRENIMKDLDMKSAKGVRTPGTAKDLVDVEEGSEPLDEHRREKSVSTVPRALILSLDRRDVVCAVRGWRRRVKDADEEQCCRLNRLSRYPNSHTKRRNLHPSTWRPVLTAKESCARSLLAGMVKFMVLGLQ